MISTVAAGLDVLADDSEYSFWVPWEAALAYDLI